jgi:hypothetical protein
MTGNVADTIITFLTGERSLAKDTGFRIRPTRDEVAQLAYYLYEVRGRQHGYDIEDWLRAEQELRHHYL